MVFLVFLQCDTSELLMVRRRGMHPPSFVDESAPYFASLKLRSLDVLMRHYLPDTRMAFDTTGEAWRQVWSGARVFLVASSSFFAIGVAFALSLDAALHLYSRHAYVLDVCVSL